MKGVQTLTFSVSIYRLLLCALRKILHRCEWVREDKVWAIAIHRKTVFFLNFVIIIFESGRRSRSECIDGSGECWKEESEGAGNKIGWRFGNLWEVKWNNMQTCPWNSARFIFYYVFSEDFKGTKFAGRSCLKLEWLFFIWETIRYSIFYFGFTDKSSEEVSR